MRLLAAAETIANLNPGVVCVCVYVQHHHHFRFFLRSCRGRKQESTTYSSPGRHVRTPSLQRPATAAVGGTCVCVCACESAPLADRSAVPATLAERSVRYGAGTVVVYATRGRCPPATVTVARAIASFPRKRRLMFRHGNCRGPS